MNDDNYEDTQDTLADALATADKSVVDAETRKVRERFVDACVRYPEEEED